jgi:hypothetical protein
MTTTGARVARVIAVVAGVGLGLVACNDSRPVLRPPPATTSTPAPAPPPLGFSDADNGRAVNVLVGQRVTVILHSSDFVFGAPTGPAIVPVDQPTVTPGGPDCIEGPGSGCGTVVASFVGLGLGDAELLADRVACVEPACGEADAHWRLQVHVVDEATANATTTVTVALGSEVRGTVLFSPICPVETDPPDPSCAPQPGPATIELARPDGIVVAQDQAGDDGEFSLSVPPGVYTVLTFGPDSAVGGGCVADPAEVALEPETSTTITVTCDTGIR